MPKRATLPDDCFLTVPAEVTPELARTCADRMGLLFQVPLLARSISDTSAAFRLLLDLGKEVIPYDRAILFWHDDPSDSLEPVETRGFEAPPPAGSWNRFLPDDSSQWSRSTLLVQDTVPSPQLAAALAEWGCSSLLSTPVYRRDRVHGVLQLLRDRAPAFGLEEAHLARVFTLAFEGVLESFSEGGRHRDIEYLDETTGLFNLRFFHRQLEREIDRARRDSEALGLLMVEVAGWEAFRNRRGPAGADPLLQEISKALERVCRKSDTLARYREDLFALLLPRTGKANLGIVAQRIFEDLEGSLPEAAQAPELAFNLSAVVYPDDAFSAESLLEAGQKGLGQARARPGRHYFQFPTPAPEIRSEEILDTSRSELFREPTFGIPALLHLFTRLTVDVVPADRISVMVREGDDLVIQVAMGFNGQEDVVRTTRVPLNRRTISAWVSQHRAPLLVQSRSEARDLPRNEGSSYRGESFFSYPLLYGEELLGIIHFSNRFDGEVFTQSDVDRFAPLAKFLSNYLEASRRFGEVREGFLRDSLFALVDLVESQIPGMAGHSREVGRLAQATALRLGFGDGKAERMWTSGRLHDLGKVSYRTNLLSEARALSPRERALTQRHPLLGWKYLESLPMTNVDRDAILYHHEREDGSGYLHKTGQETPVSAKILAVADVYQALISPRPYRPAIAPAEALRYLQGHRDTLFDPTVMDAFAEAVVPAGASTA